MKNNQLIERKNSIWIKVRLFFYKILKRNKVQPTNIQINKNNKINLKKENALNIYRRLQSNKISVEDIPVDYIDVMKEFLLKEIEVKKCKLDKIKTEIDVVSYNLNYYNKEKSKFLH